MGIDKRIMTFLSALAGFVALYGCSTNTYGVAQKSAKELKYVSDDDLCYSQRYCRSPQMMNEIARRGVVCGSSAATTGTTSGRRFIGFIPAKSINWGEGCTHYLEPVNSPHNLKHRIIFHWGLQSTDKPTMHILGKNVTVQPLTPYPEITMPRRKGATFAEQYKYGSSTMRFDNTITFVCPPASERECEVTKFNGVLTVADSGSHEKFRTTGECGH